MSFLLEYLKSLCSSLGSHTQGVILSLSLGAITLTGDFCVLVVNRDFIRVLCDSLTHGSVGFISWLIITCGSNFKHRLIESIICALFAIVIDADHFIAARSLKIKDAISLSRRPFMHCTTLVIIISVLLHASTKTLPYTHINLKRTGWLFLVATISHHIRDGNRRGLWLWPLPFWPSEYTYSTPPISKGLYVLSTIALPHVLKFFINRDSESLSLKTENVLIV